MPDEHYMLWLATLHGLGSRKQNHLLAQVGTARAAFDMPEAVLRTIPGLTETNLKTLLNGRDKQTMLACRRDMEAKRIGFISRNHSAYPKRLRDIPDPPVGLFYIGELPDDALPTVSIIGSRRCTEYGLSAARMLGKPLAQRGVVIVSGMARGIDSIAHRSALEGGGKTIAVLGCGVDICYPAENRALYEDITRNGCVISEYPPGVMPMPAYFPARNRIISGLCDITVVVEAAKKSGTLITVEQALDQGREVMAVPGNITSRYSEGTNQLIAEGAAMAIGYQDVLATLGLSDKPPAQEAAKGLDNRLAPDEKLVYDSLDFEPVTFDELVIKTNSQPHTIHYLITMLELKGFVKRLPGQRFIKNS